MSEIRHPPREHLAELLFGSAADPLGSLRWNLSELRRALGSEALPPGSAEFALPAGGLIDIDVLTRGTPQEALALPGLGRELLEGMEFEGSPAFETWLLFERGRLMGAAAAALREAALDRLAARRPAEATPLARRLVELDPYDENFQELLIRSYAQAGDKRAADEQLRSCRELFRRELVSEPNESLIRAAEEPSEGSEESPPIRLSVQQAASVLLEAGEAAAAAGATDAAIPSLRRAVSLAYDADETEVEARALFALGSVLVHGVRGRDEEGSSILRRAAELAEESGLAELRVSAVRELSYIDALAGRYSRCERRLLEASSLSASDRELAAVESVRAMAAGDRGAHDKTLEHTAKSTELAERGGDLQRMAFALSFAGRSHLLQRDLQAARTSLERSLAIVGETDWLAFASWPETWLAEAQLLEGDVEGARTRVERAFALAYEFRDPCWEGIAGRGLGLVEEREGSVAGAMRRLEEARQCAARTTDCYVWVEAYVLEALADVAIRAGSSRAGEWVEDLRSLAARTGMREMAAKAYLYRFEMGDASALEGARVMAAEIENPALEAALEAAASTTPTGI
ncbi:MAG: SARP family transcriptional regulator [Thermoleophilia bacterium]|nr:SARP family transcriptional regulator [Thermoleophilia bacterium]